MLYTIRIFKSWGGRIPDRRWVNNYEVESAATSPAGLDAVATALADAEKLIHGSQVNFLSATMSTWEPDSHPYNPLTFRTIELAGVGAVSMGSYDPMDLNVALVAKFVPTLGRSGRRFYRGCLSENDVMSAGDGSFTVQSAGGTLVRFGTFATALAPYLSAGVGTTKLVLAAGGAGSVEREIATVALGGITVSKRNHRYYDRAVG